jgi:hypothetical protein
MATVKDRRNFPSTTQAAARTLPLHAVAGIGDEVKRGFHELLQLKNKVTAYRDQYRRHRDCLGRRRRRSKQKLALARPLRAFDPETLAAPTGAREHQSM